MAMINEHISTRDQPLFDRFVVLSNFVLGNQLRNSRIIVPVLSLKKTRITHIQRHSKSISHVRPYSEALIMRFYDYACVRFMFFFLLQIISP